MSFSSELKQELAAIQNEKSCCHTSELTAYVQSIGTLSIKGQGNIQLSFNSENITLARHLLLLLRHRLKLDVKSKITKKNNFGGRYLSQISLSFEDSKWLLLRLKIINLENGKIEFLGIPRRLERRACCTKAYLRAMFLSAGSINNPQNSYRMSFTLNDEAKAIFLQKILKNLGVSSSLAERNGDKLVYISQSAGVAQALKLMGGYRAALALEESIIKGIAKKQAVRAINCDQGNIKKQLAAAQKQANAIRIIDENSGLDSLPPELKELAELRIANLEASMQSLGQMLTKKLSKSSVQLKMNRILKIADELNKNNSLRE